MICAIKIHVLLTYLLNSLFCFFMVTVKSGEECYRCVRKTKKQIRLFERKWRKKEAFQI